MLAAPVEVAAMTESPASVDTLSEGEHWCSIAKHLPHVFSVEVARGPA